MSNTPFYTKTETDYKVQDAKSQAYLGIATTTTTPPATGSFWYRVATAGTYTNFLSGGAPIVVTADDLNIVDGVAYNSVTLEVVDGLVVYKNIQGIKGAEALNNKIGRGFYEESQFIGGKVLASNGAVQIESGDWGYFKVENIAIGNVIKVGLYGHPNFFVGTKYDSAGNAVGDFGYFTGSANDFHELTFTADWNGYATFNTRKSTGVNDYAYNESKVISITEKIKENDVLLNIVEGLKKEGEFVLGTVLNPDGTVKFNSAEWGYYRLNNIEIGDVIKVGLYGSSNVTIGVKYDENGSVIDDFGYFTGADKDFHEFTFIANFNGSAVFHSRHATGENDYVYNDSKNVTLTEKLTEKINQIDILSNIGEGFKKEGELVVGAVLNPDGTVKFNSSEWGYYRLNDIKIGDVIKVGLYGNPNIAIGVKYDENGAVIGDFGYFTGADKEFNELTFIANFNGSAVFHSRHATGENDYVYNESQKVTFTEKLTEKTLKDKIVNRDKADAVKGITGNSQECTVLEFKGQTLLYHTSGFGFEHIRVYDYNIETNTVSNGKEAVGNATIGLNSDIYKCSMFFTYNGFVYGLISVWNPGSKIILVKSTDGKNFTLVRSDLQTTAGFTGYAGNHYFVNYKINGYYYWFCEGQDSGVWYMKLLRTTSDNIETATWENMGTVEGLKLDGMAGGACVYFHEGKFKCFYHYGVGGNLPTYLAYAESDINDPLHFTNIYAPLLPITRYPLAITDQIADPDVVEIKGQVYMFASYVDNTNGECRVYRWKSAKGRLSSILDSILY